MDAWIWSYSGRYHKSCRGLETRRDLVLELSLDPLNIDQICQLEKCVPR